MYSYVCMCKEYSFSDYTYIYLVKTMHQVSVCISVCITLKVFYSVLYKAVVDTCGCSLYIALYACVQ